MKKERGSEIKWDTEVWEQKVTNLSRASDESENIKWQIEKATKYTNSKSEIKKHKISNLRTEPTNREEVSSG